MAVPSDRMMQLMAKGQGAPANAAPAPDAVTPPMGAPMATPEPKFGDKEAAMINVSLALDLLNQSLPAIGSSSPEGEKIMSAVRALTGMIQPRQAKTDQLKNAEILQLLQSLPQLGGGAPEARAMMSAPPIPGLAPGGGQAPPPPPMPPAGGAMPPPGGPMPPPGGAMPM
jgi:hypothetical protein